ncbi:heme exporter protein CcmD [Nevskia soli]|uniref:heme exporter protein CcmD n=1 Tax=Nevskia soli TaxID=418856 RepID=UPI000A01455E|nr:heme exporter protein CcmD [Nevskia soli]
MNPKYALFIWSSYALALAVVLWNAFAPHFRRNDLKRRLSESLEEPQEGEQ